MIMHHQKDMLNCFHENIVLTLHFPLSQHQEIWHFFLVMITIFQIITDLINLLQTALVLVPTRELCLQVYEILQKLLHRFHWIVPGYVMGGENRSKEKARLRKGRNHVYSSTTFLLFLHLKFSFFVQQSNPQTDGNNIMQEKKSFVMMTNIV